MNIYKYIFIIKYANTEIYDYMSIKYTYNKMYVLHINRCLQIYKYINIIYKTIVINKQI